MAIVYMGAAFSGIAFVCLNYGMPHAKPTHASVVFSLEAVFGWMFGVIFLREAVTM